MKKGQQLADMHHVMRYVPWTKLRKDEDDNIIGILPAAFELRPKEKHISVNWLEYYDGDRTTQVEKCVQTFRKNFNVTKKSAFGVANVKALKDLFLNAGKPVRVEYSPTSDNPSHASIKKLPQDDLALLDLMAMDVFSDCILNSIVE